MYCSNCGHKNQDDDRFCRQCGAPLNESESPSATDLQPNSSSPTEISSQSFFEQPTQLMDSSSNQASHSIPEGSDFNESKEENSKIKSLEDLNSISLPPEQPFLNPNESNWNSPPSSPSKPSKKGKLITIGLICLTLGIVGGGAAYFFFNGEEIPFIGSIIHSDSDESSQIKIAQEGEEASSSEASSKSETGFRISIYSASSEKVSNESAITFSKETSAQSSTSSQPIKVQTLDPWAGKYKTNYVMKVRKEPSYEGERLGRKEKGEIFEVVKSEPSTNNSVWGQLPDGGWICLKDDDLVYATEIQ